MKIEPLKKELYDKAIALGIDVIHLCFEGGSDEGFLYPSLMKNNENVAYNEGYSDLCQEIEDWVWEVYSYSGAGDGSRYGDNIQYDLVNKTASHDDWYMVEQYGDKTEGPMEFD